MKVCSQCQHENPQELLYCENCFAQLPRGVTAYVARDDLPEAFEPSTVMASVTTDVASKASEEVQASPAALALPQLGQGARDFADIWGPFAGYGQRGRHVSWMLDEQGANAARLRDVVTSRFDQRAIPNTRVYRRTLRAKGLIVETRPYYLIQRGITTMGLYIAQLGRDLFISQVTYTLGPMDPLRVAILALMLLFQLFMIFGYGSAVQSSLGTIDLFRGYTGDASTLGLLLCCVAPLGILNTFMLLLAGLYSAYKFLTEKDPLALLRRLPNEFEHDDIVALEKAVEETVRQALDAIDLDGSKMAPSLQYGPKERLL